MHAHPLIHGEIARQRELELRRPRARKDRSPEPATTRTAALTPIVRAATQGDGQAWELLVTRFTPTLRGVVRGYRLNAVDVDDVVQTTWASAFAHIDCLREPEAFGSWLMVMARRAALRTLERGRREIPVDDVAFPDENGHSAPEGAIIEAEQRQVVHAAVDRLPGRQRTLLRTMLRDSAVGYADLSSSLGMPVGSIGPTRKRALARLRRDRGLGVFVTSS